MKLPTPGEHLGWVVVYGPPDHRLQVWCHQDYEHAMQVAVRHRAVMVVQAIAGATHVWQQPDGKPAAATRAAE